MSPAMRRVTNRILRTAAERLREPRRTALLGLARSGRTLVTGKSQAPQPARTRALPGAQPAVPMYPSSFSVRPPAPPIPEPWPEPPSIERTGKDPAGRTVYPASGDKIVFDVELFLALNEEYATKPLVPRPQSLEPAAVADRARARIAGVHKAIDLSGRTVLEIGCGNGYETWYVGEHLGSDAYGLDVTERLPWRVLSNGRATYVCADFTVEQPFAECFFDRVISFAVWEHIVRPEAALAETFRIMKPGGLAWIRANLYRGPKASHLYRDISFPWPHLLFTDEVFREFYRRIGKPPRGASWVNRMTWEQYERAMLETGFRIKMLRFATTPIDEAFYARFWNVLGRYPRPDLERDFFTVVLEKPTSS